MRETQNLLIADSNPTRSRVFANSRHFATFFFNSIELLSFVFSQVFAKHSFASVSNIFGH